MSIAAMNWAWRQPLVPTVKLVLMSLADAADDHGVCWPSVSTVARKCGVSNRTVRRIIQDLVASGLLRREPRFRNDGSHSSNRYTLVLEGGDKLSRAPVTGVSTPGTGRQTRGDSGVRPRTTSESHRESPQPPPKVSMPAAPVATASTDVGSGGDDGDQVSCRLEYPRGLMQTERVEACKKLADLPVDLAQQLLDELAGRMQAGTIRITPLAYLRGLITKATSGDFTPEVALQVAGDRQRRRRNEAVLRQAEATRMSTLRKEVGAASHAVDSPILRRLVAIRNRSHRDSGRGE